VTRPILETEGLTKRFGSLVANDRLSVTVEEDTIHGIMGPNGSGKSTFFNTVTGFYRPDGGTVRFDGEDVTGWKPDEIARRGLARTFQIPSPFEDLTVKENMLAVFTGGLRSGMRISRRNAPAPTNCSNSSRSTTSPIRRPAGSRAGRRNCSNSGGS